LTFSMLDRHLGNGDGRVKKRALPSANSSA
jgi:hypothetical protein